MNCNNQTGFYVEVTNSALLVARFSIIYDQKTQQTDNILIGGVRRLYLPQGCNFVEVKVEWAYPPWIWETLYDCENILCNRNHCYTIYGSFFLPTIKETPCTNSVNQCNPNIIQILNDPCMLNMYNNYLSNFYKYDLQRQCLINNIKKNYLC